MPASRTWVSRSIRIAGLLLVALALLAAGYFAATSGLLASLPLFGQSQGAGAAPAQQDAAPTLTTIRSAADTVGTVTAAGNLELVSQRQVVLKVSGEVQSVAADIGDQVKAGDLLVVVDGTELEAAVADALLDLAAAQNAMDDLLADADASEVAVAQANLLSAQENLAEVRAGPSDQELAAARSKVAAAVAELGELEEGPTAAELVQLSADLRKAEVALGVAQSAYDRIAWQTSAGTSSEAADLQDATIDYESTKAAYDEATAPATDSEMESANSTLQSAQEELDNLLSQPSAADIATAEASVMEAEAALADLLEGADAKLLEDARLDLARAQLVVENAAADLAASQLRAPIDGTVMEVNVQVGERVADGTSAVVLADVHQLQLTVNVAEVDVDKITEGTQAQISLDALTGREFAGEVTRIAPSTDPDSSVVNYPVTIRLTDDDLSGARPGMTAVASLSSPSADGGWLVPVNAVRTQGSTSRVMVMRDGAPTPVSVTVGSTEGEWVVVQSGELQAGDQVVGSVTSVIDPDASPFFRPGGGGPPGDGVRLRGP